MAIYEERPMTTGAWFLTLLVLAIPLLNLVMYIVWACGVGNVNRVTFCRATILWMLIGVAAYVILAALGIGGAALMQMK
jgi:hypothetical protein